MKPDSRSAALRVLVIGGPEDLKAEAAGPSWELAKTLSSVHDVILAVPKVTGASHRRFAVVYYNRRNIGLLVKDSDLAILGRSAGEAHPELLDTGSLKAVSKDKIQRGSFDEGRAPGNHPLKELGSDELLVLRPDFSRAPSRGMSHYFSRFRFHLRQGGARQAASRGGSLIKRKMRGQQ